MTLYHHPCGAAGQCHCLSQALQRLLPAEGVFISREASQHYNNGRCFISCAHTGARHIEDHV
jgi:hypothetical protein